MPRFFAIWTVLSLILGLLSNPAAAETPYTGLLMKALVQGPEGADLTALRESYIKEPAYTGSSHLKEILAGAMLADTDQPPPDADAIKHAIALDYPLLDAHGAAFAYFKSTDPNNKKALGHHAAWYLALLDSITAAAVTEGKITTYKVLSVGEEREILASLKLPTGTQQLVMVAGEPRDVYRFPDREIHFDISAFFGKE